MAEFELFGNVTSQEFLFFMFVIIFTFILGSTLNVIIIRFLKDRAKPAVYKTISKVGMYGIYAAGLFFAFNNIIKFDISASLAALGILGVGLLLPTVPLLQNIAAGIVLALERSMQEDDIVEFRGEVCKVKDVMLRKTVLRSLDGKIIIAPNLQFITSEPIINYSKGEFIKVVLPIDILSSMDREKAEKIIKDICSESMDILPNLPEKKISMVTRLLSIPKHFFTIPRNIHSLNPIVLTKGVSRDKVSLEIWFWIWDIRKKQKVISTFYNSVLEKFRNEGISLG
ncbi:mechanosensitive ion channel [Candidatus Woesearchaeota archaeon]|nr:mechanosensitive ion channel [Candidatus Woesearchaeota archaeon]